MNRKQYSYLIQVLCVIQHDVATIKHIKILLDKRFLNVLHSLW